MSCAIEEEAMLVAARLAAHLAAPLCSPSVHCRVCGIMIKHVQSPADCEAHEDACAIATGCELVSTLSLPAGVHATSANLLLSPLRGVVDGGGLAHEVLPGVWLGGISAACDVAWLDAKHISSIVNCTNDEAPVPYPPCRLIHCVPLEDSPDPAYAPLAVTLLRRGASAVAASTRDGQHVLVHCRQGRSRSAAVLAAALVLGGVGGRSGVSLLEALATVHRARQIALPNICFLACLVALERGVRGALPCTPTPPLTMPASAAAGAQSHEGGAAPHPCFPLALAEVHRAVLLRRYDSGSGARCSAAAVSFGDLVQHAASALTEAACVRDLVGRADLVEHLVRLQWRRR